MNPQMEQGDPHHALFRLPSVISLRAALARLEAAAFKAPKRRLQTTNDSRSTICAGKSYRADCLYERRVRRRVKAAASRPRDCLCVSQLRCYVAALLYLSLLLTPAAAWSESIAFELGYGEDTRIQSLDLDFDWCRTCRLAAPEHTSLAWEFTAQAMQGHRPHEANDNLFAFGAMPLLRYGWPDRDGRVFVEDGIGVHLVSRTRLYNERELSTAFQFGELLGIGLRFCRHNACETGIRLQHMSNADIKKPNDSVAYLP